MRFQIALIMGLWAFAANARECSEELGKARLSRVVAVDSSGAPVYGAMTVAPSDARQTKPPFALTDKEVVLTFEIGSRSPYTAYILDILDRNCLKATFFFTPSAIKADPTAVLDVVRRGHTIGIAAVPSSKKLEAAAPDAWKGNVDAGLTDIAKLTHAEVAPFVRPKGWLPSAQDVQGYFSVKNISIWGADVFAPSLGGDGAATKVANAVLLKIKQQGKAVIAFDGTRLSTVDSLDSILYNLRHEGFKVVHVVPSTFFAGVNKTSASPN